MKPNLWIGHCVQWLVLTLIVLMVWPVQAQSGTSLVTAQHLNAINTSFSREGVVYGRAELDSFGRVELRGEYADEVEVDRAFSLAQVVVGSRWVSPVTPENIRVKTWEKKLGGLFARANVLKPALRPGAGSVGPIRNRYALVVGIGRFKHGVNPLQYATQDAFTFFQFLTDPNRGKFKQENVIFLSDESATHANITRAFDKLRQMAEEDDLVTVFISSHGTPPDKKGAVNIVLHDTETKPRERIWHTSVTEEMLKGFVDGLRARRLVMVLDACFSNGAYRAVPGFLPPGGKSLGADENEGYGISREYSRRLVTGAKDLVFEDDAVAHTQSKTADLGAVEPHGIVLISASGSNEQSWESEKLRNGIFTYYFVDGLNRFNGSVQQAFYYAQPRVISYVKEEKGRDIDQNPQATATAPNWDMRLMAR